VRIDDNITDISMQLVIISPAWLKYTDTVTDTRPIWQKTALIHPYACMS